MSRFLPSFLPSLGLVFSYIFMWSNNAHMFSPQSIIASVLVIILFSIVIFGINYFVIPRIIQRFLQDKWYQIVFSLYIAFVFTILLACLVDYGLYNQRRLYASMLFIISFIFLYTKKTKILVTFLTLLLCFSSITLIKNSIFEDEYIFNKKVSAIELKKKPNIYLYWLESYHDFDVLKRVYNVDSSGYRKYLSDKQFTISENIFSSGRYTLMAFTQLYSCLRVDKTVGNNDVMLSFRSLIGGDENNFVFRILKENGYKTIFLAGSYYYLNKKGQYLDEVDVDLNNLLYPINSVGFVSDRKIMHIVPGKGLGNGYKGTLSDRVKTAMKRGKESEKPYLIVFKGGAEHFCDRWKDREALISSNAYQSLIQKSNVESEEIINYILENDPDALIVLLGDHGCLTYQGFPWEHPESYAKYNVREEDVFDDIFRVLFAYRLPGGAQDDIAHGMYMNNVNIFTHIFAYLAEDPSLLADRTQSVSVLPGTRTKVVEGKFVRE